MYIYLCGVLNKLRPDHPSSVGAYEEVRMLHVDLLKIGKCMNQVWFGSMLPVFVIFRMSYYQYFRKKGFCRFDSSQTEELLFL